MAKFTVGPTVGVVAETFRVGTKDTPLVDADIGKAVKIVAGESGQAPFAGSRVVLAEANDEIFGFLSSVEPYTQDGYAIGGVVTTGYARVDTAGLHIGGLVVVDSNPSEGTAGPTKVKNAPSATVVEVRDSAGTGTEELTIPYAGIFMWQVVENGVIRKV